MKTIFRFLGLAVLISGFAVASGTSVFAQDPPAAPAPAANPCEDAPGQEALYTKVSTNYADKDWRKRQIAVDAAEEYLKRFGACETLKVQTDYLKGFIQPTKEGIIFQEKKEKIDALFEKWAPATKANNWDESYSLGKQILAIDPEQLNVILVLGSIGLDETLKTPRVTKYNDDTLKYARMAIDKLNAGKTTSTFGYHTFTYAVKENPKDPKSKTNNLASKENALGWLNYTIGGITYYGQNNKKEGLVYLYKATQAKSDTAKLPPVYAIIGDYYFDEVRRLAEEYKAKIIAAGNKDTDETKAITASLKAYAERAIDAYARAQSYVVDKVKGAEYSKALGGQVETLYKLRFEKVDGLTAFVTDTLKKPLPDPTSVPAPIIEAEPTAAPTTTGAATPNGTTPAGNGTKPGTTPATNGTKPAANSPAGTKKPVSTNGTSTVPAANMTVAAKPAVKKPVIKKKGTR